MQGSCCAGIAAWGSILKKQKNNHSISQVEVVAGPITCRDRGRSALPPGIAGALELGSGVLVDKGGSILRGRIASWNREVRTLRLCVLNNTMLRKKDYYRGLCQSSGPRETHDYRRNYNL